MIIIIKRKFDPRSGSNPFIVYDYSTPIDEKLEQRFIVRHRLNKKIPNEEISEPLSQLYTTSIMELQNQLKLH
jgi:hypothetical protein